MSNALSDTELDQKLSKIPAYQGAFSCDTLPRPAKKSINYYIANLEPSYMEGSHWIAILEYPDDLYYIDPFGLPPNKDILNWIHSRKKEWFYNNSDIQGLNSSSCGKYCSYVIIKANEGLDPEEILDHLEGLGIRNSEKTVVQKWRKK